MWPKWAILKGHGNIFSHKSSQKIGDKLDLWRNLKLLRLLLGKFCKKIGLLFIPASGHTVNDGQVKLFFFIFTPKVECKSRQVSLGVVNNKAAMQRRSFAFSAYLKSIFGFRFKPCIAKGLNECFEMTLILIVTIFYSKIKENLSSHVNRHTLSKRNLLMKANLSSDYKR